MGDSLETQSVQVVSESTVTVNIGFDDDLYYEVIDGNTENYTDFRPTEIQFEILSDDIAASGQVRLSLVNKLTRTHQKQAKIYVFDQSIFTWLPVDTTYNKDMQELAFEFERPGIYTVFINHYWYTSFTQRLADEFPNWTEIRKSADSVGQQFLNYFGIELETIKDYLEWIKEQRYIGTADMTVMDWVKMYETPSLQPTDNFTIKDLAGNVIPQLETLKEFFFNESGEGGILDYQQSRFYTTKDYGDITISLNGSVNGLLVTSRDHHIWNTFDEFAMLVGLQRKHLEKNEDLKERILDVFRYPAGAHDIGLTNGIAQEMMLIKRTGRDGSKLIWIDDTKNFYLKNTTGRKIDPRTIRIDAQPLKSSEYTTDSTGSILILATHTGREREVSYISGIEKYELYDKSDEALRLMMFSDDGQETQTLKRWVEYINTVAPVMWGRLRWDEGFWDTIDKKLTGLGYLPNTWDSNIDVWKDYIFPSDR